MTWRAIVIAALLGLWVAGFTYYNDHVIRQTFLTGNCLPVAVFGVVLLWLLGLNPLAGFVTDAWRRRAALVAGVTWAALAAYHLTLPGMGLGEALGVVQGDHFDGGRWAWMALRLLPLVIGCVGSVGLWCVLANLALAPRGLGGRLRLAAALGAVALLLVVLMRPGTDVSVGAQALTPRAFWPSSWWSAPLNPVRVLVWLGMLLATLGGIVVLPLQRGRDYAALRGSEIALAAALGLIVCSWPASNLLRYFTHLAVNPGRELGIQTSWQAVNVMSYVPDSSPLLAEGFVRDWPGLIQRLREGGGRSFADGVLARFEPADRTLLRQVDPQRPAPVEREKLVAALNRALSDPGLAGAQALTGLDLSPRARALVAQRAEHGLSAHEAILLNRLALEAALPGVFRPMPPGEGLLLNHGVDDPALTGPLVGGWIGPRWLRPWELPWGEWWPVLRLWLGSALFLGLATLCLMVVVHPQWSKRELLAYPTVQFVSEMTAWRPGAYLPRIAASRLFWTGLAGVALLHLANGWKAWQPEFPGVMREFDFSSLQQLFPNTQNVAGANLLFRPVLYFSAIGFAYLITTRVSVSMGLSLPLWVVLGAWLKSFGSNLDNNRWAIDANGTSVRFGAYLGLTLMILYFGRRYYWRVAAGAVGLPQPPEIPRYAIWAGRGFALFSGLTVFLLVRYAGLDWFMALLLIAATLIILVVLARINVETGLFYAQPDFVPAMMLGGWFGLEGLGPTTLIVLTMASIIFVADPRESLSAFAVNGLEMAERVGGVRPRRTTGLLILWATAGLLVALVVMFTLQYNLGLDATDGWPPGLPRNTLNRGAATVRSLATSGQLGPSLDAAGLGRLAAARPVAEVVHWSLLGMGLVLVCALGRIRFAWWPLHPVLFVVWGTYPANHFAASFLVAGLVKAAVVKIGGERGYQQAKPLMVGLIAGELLAILFWALVGSVYYLTTGQPPKLYAILPR